MKLGIALSAAVVALAACGLTPGPAPAIRLYTAMPEGPPASADFAGPATQATSAVRPPLRIRRVSAARHLGERFVWRAGDEYGQRELERWTELPEAVVGRALERALFESGRFRRDGRAELALDIEVRRFEERRSPAPRAVIVALGVLVTGAGERAVLDTTATVEEALRGDGAAEVAQAMQRAVARAVAGVVELLPHDGEE